MEKPTLIQFQTLDQLYDYFNKSLFDSKLKSCLINLSRKSHAHGFFSNNAWIKSTEKIDEISLNPETMGRPMQDILSTLVHEMCHLWQFQYGKPSVTYHNKQWAEKMHRVGLLPYSSSNPGKETGKNCSHKIDPSGPFMKSFKKIDPASLIKILPNHVYVEKKKKANRAKNKIKYSCPSCEANVWGKPDLNIVCEDCEKKYLAVD